jgi:hypothetical protein
MSEISTGGNFWAKSNLKLGEHFPVLQCNSIFDNEDFDREKLVSTAGTHLLRMKEELRIRQLEMCSQKDKNIFDEQLVIEDFSRPSTPSLNKAKTNNNQVGDLNKRKPSSGCKSARGRIISSSYLRSRKCQDMVSTTVNKLPLTGSQSNTLRPSSSHCDFRQVQPKPVTHSQGLGLPPKSASLTIAASHGQLPRASTRQVERHDLKRPPSRKKVIILFPQSSFVILWALFSELAYSLILSTVQFCLFRTQHIYKSKSTVLLCSRMFHLNFVFSRLLSVFTRATLKMQT